MLCISMGFKHNGVCSAGFSLGPGTQPTVNFRSARGSGEACASHLDSHCHSKHPALLLMTHVAKLTSLTNSISLEFGLGQDIEAPYDRSLQNSSLFDRTQLGSLLAIKRHHRLLVRGIETGKESGGSNRVVGSLP
jgi:hypothetical protein